MCQVKVYTPFYKKIKVSDKYITHYLIFLAVPFEDSA